MQTLNMKKFFSIGKNPNTGKYVVMLNWPLPGVFASADQDTIEQCQELMQEFVGALMEILGIPATEVQMRIYKAEKSGRDE